MHAGKALVLFFLASVSVFGGVFTFVPSTRPPLVKKWFRAAYGFSEAKSPQEALDKFKDCVKNRDYETAAELYCAGEYREQMLKGAAAGKALGQMIDSLVDNMNKRGITSPNTKVMLKLLEPFPKTFVVTNISEKGDRAVATLGSEVETTVPDRPLPNDFFVKHGLLVNSLVPLSPEGVGLTRVLLVKGPSGAWKLDLPVTTRLRLSVDALKENGLNYRNAIEQVRDEVKNNPTTKDQIQSELERRLNESR